MNMIHSMFCDFVLVNAESNSYICAVCGNSITVYDSYQDPPQMICRSTILNSNALTSGDIKINNQDYSNEKICTQKEIEDRFSICRYCEFFNNNSCDKCGCPLMRDNVFAQKLRLANEECPIGRWSKI